MGFQRHGLVKFLSGGEVEPVVVAFGGFSTGAVVVVEAAGCLRFSSLVLCALYPRLLIPDFISSRFFLSMPRSASEGGFSGSRAR